MKSIGVVRRLDVLGRLALPKELRRSMNIGKGTPMEMLVDGESLILKKYEPECVFCGNAERVQDFHGKRVFAGCARELFSQFKGTS